METQLKILMLEDSPEDVELIQREIRKGGLKFVAKVVDTKEEFMKEYYSFLPDLILSDHSMPRFNSMEAMKLCKVLKFSGPFILVTGTVSEEFAVTSIKEGADDYILKSNLLRLVPAILHALRSRSLEREKEEAISKLRLSEERIRNFAGHLNQVMEDERAHIAREIHDELGQQLAGIKYSLSDLCAVNPEEKDKDKVEKIFRDIDESLQSMRKIATQLRPGILDSLGLIPSLQWLAEGFEKKTGIKCIFSLRGEERNFDKKTATAVFRICQESFTNIAKHAGACKVGVMVEDDGNRFSVVITDDGKGMSEGKLDNPFSMGLLGMQERANNIGALLEISSEKDKGTKVKLVIPEYHS
ncbi:MAG TPA: histidine kinase [Bacteroidia bacterium]|jgi:signal transduction histidine kinase|nr:histidine kinase [Bacteroidia bacterium]